LLAGELVQLTEHGSISRETVRRRLAENDLKPRRKDMWCIPQVDGEYVARMEDVLDLYAEPPDPKRPVVCNLGRELQSKMVLSAHELKEFQVLKPKAAIQAIRYRFSETESAIPRN
jgi:hypothetical protein